MITFNGNVPLAAAIKFADDKGMVLIFQRSTGRFACTEPGRTPPGWRRYRVGYPRIIPG